jgi:two-component system chemotaxis sensor kinase CheA
MSDCDDLVKEFLVESHENLDQLDRDFVELEKLPGDREILARIFRTIHTIKGTSGFFDFTKLQALAHAGENLLAMLRDGALEVTPSRTTALLTMVDAVRVLLASIEATGGEGDGDYAPLAAQLEGLMKPEPPAERLTDILVRDGKTTPEEVERAVEAQQAGDPRRVGEILVEQGAIRPKDVVEALQAQQDGKSAGVSEGTLRVDVGLLDRLMNQVGELVLARNQILRLGSGLDDPGFRAAVQRLNLVTTELQEGVMKTRMQPIGNVWSKFPRVVRDLAMQCGKRVRLELEGRDTELDKTILEAIKDPLTHLVRNSVDHGIETPDARAQAGKNPEGLLRLSAYHEGGQVILEVLDDGAGIRAERIKAKALEKGLVAADRLARMGDPEALQLIFLPGFSTAEKVTNVSGRGVGMDVVRTNIERIGGTMDLSSEPGVGTRLKIKIPLTLAIIPALLVSGDGDRFAIPQVNLLELVRLDADEAAKAIENVYGAPVYRLRGRLLPLVDLRGELRLPPRADAAAAVNIVVLQGDGQAFGLVVDAVHDTEEIVVKPLGSHLKRLGVYAGATILGDGRVSLILDVLGLAKQARLGAHDREAAAASAVTDATSAAEKQSLLIVAAGTTRAGVPLSEVARLEEVRREAVEATGGADVLQYGGGILPLVRLDDILPERRAVARGASSDDAADGTLSVVVLRNGDRPVGLVVDRILDIVMQDVRVRRPAGRDGVLFAAVVQDKVTEVVDVERLLQRALPDSAAAC